MTNIIQTLEATKDALFRYGRSTGKIYESNTGAVCLLGAVGVATRGEFWETRAWYDDQDTVEESLYEDTPVIEALAEQVRKGVDVRYPMESAHALLYGFNDKRTTSFGDVIDLIDNTIIAEKEKL